MMSYVPVQVIFLLFPLDGPRNRVHYDQAGLPDNTRVPINGGILKDHRALFRL